MSKTCVFMYGRMNPCHKGHGFVFDQALGLKNCSTDVKLFLSSSYDMERNPLPREMRQYFISEFFPDISPSIQDVYVKNLFDIMKSLDGEYSDIIFVGGSDRTMDFKKVLDTYNGKEYNFDSIQTVLAGSDRQDSIFSSTYMRNSVLNNDFVSFKECIPGDNDKLKYEMYCAVQKHMGKI